MPDYDFSRLGTRSFEQLVQALGVRVVGAALTPFGDGPDGGREATFDGVMEYPNDLEPWSGYGVVQAKFRQRPLGQPNDTTWALANLKDELEAFVAHDSSRKPPEYYVFATNIVLSSTTGGGKDQARALIQGYQNRLPLRDFAVWDYDQLRAYIDDAQDIRSAYAGWITPGDVLDAAFARLQGSTSPDFSEVIDLYLQRGLLADQYARLEQAGASPEDNIPLANVFVDLPVTFEPADFAIAESGDETAVATLVEHAQLKLDPQSSAALPRAIEGEPGRFVLIGGPGQGKSTIGQFLCQMFRFAILQERSTLPAEVRAALDGVRKQVEAENLEHRVPHRFPVRVVLSDFANSLADGQVSTLLGFIAGRMGRALDRTVSADDVRVWLTEYPWVLVLDGLDEVPASSNRQDVLRAIKEFWIDATAANADILVLATTRPQGYNEDFGRNLYRHMTMLPLEPAAALRYAERLVQTRYAADHERQEKILSRLVRATESDATARLLYTPLQVTIMSTLVDRIGRPPQERWSLFNAYYDVIYQREVERDIPAASLLRDHKADIDAIHQWVGLLLQIESERSGGTEARLNTDQLTQLVEVRLRLEGHQGDDLSFLRDQIIEAAGMRLVFLVGVEDDAIGFELRSLQEFMAAEGLMAGGDTQVVARLSEVAHLQHWRNTFLFAAGKCFADRQHLRDSIYTICSSLDDDSARPTARATRAGSRLAIDILRDGPARRQPKYAQLFAQEALRVLELPPDRAQRELADLYEPTVAHLFEDALTAQLHAQHPRPATWALLLSLAERNVPLATTLIERFEPSSDDDIAEVVRVGIVAGPDEFRGKLLDGLRLLSFPELTGFRHRHQVEGPLADQLGRTTRDGEANPWQLAILQIAGQWITGRRNFNVQSTTGHLPMRISAMPVDGLNAALADIPKPSRGWMPIVEGACFGLNPSAAQLATSLRAMEHLEKEVSQIDYLLPWPLAACLDEASRGTWQEEIERLAGLASAGRFGDTKDWAAAEARWQSAGVIYRDFEAMLTEESWPFPSSISEEGFPFAIAGLSTLGVVRGEAVSNFYRTLPPSRLRGEVGAWVIQNQALYSIDAHLDGGLDDMVLAQALRDASDVDRYALLPTFDDYEVNGGAIAEAIDYAGTRCQLDGYLRRGTQLIDLLVSTFQDSPSRAGLLRALGWLAPQTNGRLPREVLPLADDDPANREAALLLLLTSQDWTEEEAPQLARDIVHLAAGRDWGLVERAAEAVHNGRGASSRFLVDLLDQLDESEAPSDVQATVLAVMTGDLQRFPSRLNEATFLADLGFPDDLSRMLGTD